MGFGFRRSRRRLAVVLPFVAFVAACSAAPTPWTVPPTGPFVYSNGQRAFEPGSWWNTPLPVDAPANPNAAAVLDYMRTAPQAGGGCVRLAGARSGDWGQPVYWAQPSDPVYDVDVKIADQAPELHSLRIPANAEAAPTSDAAMTIFDLEKGYVVALTGASFDESERTWSARGATVTYLTSNGLNGRIEGSDDPRNVGSHRGNNGATMMVRFDEVRTGRVNHVLKVASGPVVSVRSAFPMVGSDGDSTDPSAPPQGLRFRLKPSVDVAAFDIPPEAKVIARAFQTYGFYIGDSSGVTALKLENTEAEGRGDLWSLPPTALCSIPLESRFWDVLPEGYTPPKASG